jgi:hypothetical protein
MENATISTVLKNALKIVKCLISSNGSVHRSLR